MYQRILTLSHPQLNCLSFYCSSSKNLAPLIMQHLSINRANRLTIQYLSIKQSQQSPYFGKPMPRCFNVSASNWSTYHRKLRSTNKWVVHMALVICAIHCSYSASKLLIRDDIVLLFFKYLLPLKECSIWQLSQLHWNIAIFPLIIQLSKDVINLLH